MQISGTVAAPSVQGVTAQSPADIAYTAGFSAVGNGTAWVLTPSDVFAVTTLASAATQTIDWSVAGVFLITLTANTTFTFKNVAVGQNIMLVLTQDGTGSRTGTFPSGAIFVGGSKTLTTTASGIDTVQITCTGAGVYLCQLLKAYA